MKTSDRIFPKADLQRADLHGADLPKANLYGADLCWADLHGANLREANLRGTDLRWADLRWADLHGADLREANLHEANFHGVKGYVVGPIRSDGYRFDARWHNDAWRVVAGCHTPQNWTFSAYVEHTNSYNDMGKRFETLSILRFLEERTKQQQRQ